MKDIAALKRSMILVVVIELVYTVEIVVFAENGGRNCVPKGDVDIFLGLVDKKFG